MKNRNAIVELARFLFSILVVGYHIRLSVNDGVTGLFENGALAVEFFFLLSGYFLARSIEKVSEKEDCGIVSESFRFIKGKIKGILPTHIIANAAAVLVILAFNLGNAGELIFRGLPSLFLAQMALVWSNSYESALIIPEWYLSSMLICMVIMFPIALLLRRKIRGEAVTAVLTGILAVMTAVGILIDGALPQNFIYDLRAWGEMCVGMFAYYLSQKLSVLNSERISNRFLQIVEVICYTVPIIFGIAPLSRSMMPVCMVVTVVCIFVSLSVTFSGRGVQIKNEKAGKGFAYLGSISLAIYLFHPVLIPLLDNVLHDASFLLKSLVIFPLTLALASLFNLIVKKIAAAKR